MKFSVEKAVRINVDMTENELVIVLAALGSFSDHTWQQLIDEQRAKNSEIQPNGGAAAERAVYQSLWDALQEVRR